MSLAKGGSSFILVNNEVSTTTKRFNTSLAVTISVVVTVFTTVLAISGLLRDSLNIHTQDLLTPSLAFDASTGYSSPEPHAGWMLLWIFITVIMITVFLMGSIELITRKKQSVVLWILCLVGMLTVGLTSPIAIPATHGDVAGWAQARYGVTISPNSALVDNGTIRNAKTGDAITSRRMDGKIYLYQFNNGQELPRVYP